MVRTRVVVMDRDWDIPAFRRVLQLEATLHAFRCDHKLLEILFIATVKRELHLRPNQFCQPPAIFWSFCQEQCTGPAIRRMILCPDKQLSQIMVTVLHRRAYCERRAVSSGWSNRQGRIQCMNAVRTLGVCKSILGVRRDCDHWISAQSQL